MSVNYDVVIPKLFRWKRDSELKTKVNGFNIEHYNNYFFKIIIGPSTDKNTKNRYWNVKIYLKLNHFNSVYKNLSDENLEKYNLLIDKKVIKYLSTKNANKILLFEILFPRKSIEVKQFLKTLNETYKFKDKPYNITTEFLKIIPIKYLKSYENKNTDIKKIIRYHTIKLDVEVKNFAILV